MATILQIMETELKLNWKTYMIGLVLGSSGPDLTHFFPMVKGELRGFSLYIFKNTNVVVRC